MKKLMCLAIILTSLISCSDDDDNNRESDSSIVLGARYEFNVTPCEPLPLENNCVAFILFVNENEVSYLPFGDGIFILPYEINEGVVTILLSNDLDDPTYLIESEDVLVEETTGNRFIRQ